MFKRISEAYDVLSDGGWACLVSSLSLFPLLTAELTKRESLLILLCERERGREEHGGRSLSTLVSQLLRGDLWMFSLPPTLPLFDR
jgi:hypothetical protein